MDWNDEHCPDCGAYFEDCECGFFNGDESGQDQDSQIVKPVRAEVFMQIIYKVVGAQAKSQNIDEGTTVGELKAALNFGSHTATVNGASAADDQALSDGDYVNLAQAVKGGC